MYWSAFHPFCSALSSSDKNAMVGVISTVKVFDISDFILPIRILDNNSHRLLKIRCLYVDNTFITYLLNLCV